MMKCGSLFFSRLNECHCRKAMWDTKLEPCLSEEKMTEQRRGKGAEDTWKGILMTTDFAIKVK